MGSHVEPNLRSTAEIDSYNYDHDYEEALSLRDLPITPSRTSISTVDHNQTTTSSSNHSRRSSSPEFLFEFVVNNDEKDRHRHVITSFADDVIFHGRLLPYFNPPTLPRRSLSLSSTRRVDSASRPRTRTIRPSRSLDCREVRRNSTAKSELTRSYNNNNNPDPKASPWYWLIFGFPVRITAEMEVKDIKNRLLRRSNQPLSWFSGGWERFPGERRSTSASWRILSVLSCRSVQVKNDVVSKRFSPKCYFKDVTT